ncbi:MAG: hypothetical protein E4H03_04410 [Myxococcales bacterium]|nr:MAG: hypothetical protein E4H03_04410 [Myxococcales bacterium]
MLRSVVRGARVAGIVGVFLGAMTTPAIGGGPIVLSGHDADDHGFESQYVGLFDAILANATNGGSGILAIGADPGSEAGNWITTVASLMAVPQTVTFVNDASISTQSFSGFAILHVPSTTVDVTGGIHVTNEIPLLTARASDIADFINAGGGLFGLTQDAAADAYDYLGLFADITAVGVPSSGACGGGASYDDVSATTEGQLLGITDTNIDGCCWHNVFSSHAGFLNVLATANEPGCTGPVIDGLASVIGCLRCNVPGQKNLTPALDYNPPNTNHTVTATLLDSDPPNNPVSGVTVTFTVISGPNTGDTGTDPTDVNGQATFTYLGDGGIGVDRISATCTDPITSDLVTSNDALKFWDLDCNGNSIPDTCDISCAGFGGDCIEFAACGGSADLNSNSVPDDCDACVTNGDCDDSNVCTDDVCNPAVGCFNTNNTASCNDADACTTVDQCVAGSCTGSSPPNCNDGNVCTDDSCSPATGCVNTNNTASCNDGNACTTVDQCVAGTCTGSSPPNCNDSNVCTNDSCNPATGCVNASNTASCNDGDACTTVDLCVSGTCTGSTPPNCNDGNVCTDDSCNPASGCVHAINTASCDDFDACTTIDQCVSGTCTGSTPPNCNDSNVCTDDSCNPASGCVHADNTTPCDDGDACTTVDQCFGGSCVGSTPPNCNDSNVCTNDSCNPASGCVHASNAAFCDDGNACTTVDQCVGGTCAGSTPSNCDDLNVCTNDSCNPATGCVNINNAASCNDGNACTTVDQCVGGSCTGSTPPNCDDSNVCTNDSCSPATGCVHINNAGSCNDGNACTTVDQCVGGSCAGSTPPNCDDSNVCTNDSCSPATGCVNANNAAPCDDGDACTTVDQCAGGTCTGSAPPNCGDSNLCTDDSCNPATGCVHTDNTAPCNDADACTTSDVCSGGICVGSAPPQCNDGNACTTDSCDPGGGCVNANNTVPCPDGNACNGDEICGGGSCQPATSLDCNDGDVCTSDSCNPATGCVNANNTAPCDDGNACTTVDQCSGGTCTGSVPPNCDDSNVCTSDSCNPASGCVNTDNAAACDDGDACTTVDQCAGGSCAGSAPPDCNDLNLCTDDSCNPATGCVNANNTAPCNDGNACTTVDQCSGGTCTGSVPPNCDDSNLCTDDSCNPAGGCMHANNLDPCPDGDVCNGGEICGGGSCQPAIALDCADGDLCTDDSCNPASGCVNADNTAPCDDANACTVADACSGGVCAGGAPADCSDGNACTDDSCIPASGCLNANNSAPCPDGDLCNGDEVCGGGSCQPAIAPNCDDGLFCTGIETCDPINGCQAGTALICDDGDSDTIDCCDEDLNMCSLDGSGCCGNGTIDIDLGEQCDAPLLEICDNLIDDDRDGVFDCADEDCAPTGCDSTCMFTRCGCIANDPAIIKVPTAGKTGFWRVHGRIAIDLAFAPDPSVDGMSILLTNANGLIYKAVIGPGEMCGSRPCIEDRSKGRFRYKDVSAKDGVSPAGAHAGLFRLSLRNRIVKGKRDPVGSPFFTFKIKAYSYDFAAADDPSLAIMSTQVVTGSTLGSLTAAWNHANQGWRIRPEDYPPCPNQ